MNALANVALLALQLGSAARYVAEHHEPAVDALVAAARAHPVLIVGDVHPAAAPKQLLTELLASLHGEALLDAVALEVPMTQQPAVRRYLASDPEDLQLLYDHPLLLRAHWGASREYIDVYRTVWRLNRATPERPVEILAVDAPRGPPTVGSRREALARFVNRDAVMSVRIRRWREANSTKRLLVFVGDLHALKGVEADVAVAGEFDWLIPLATRLERASPGSVATAFSDAAPPGHERGASRLYPLVRGALGDSVGPVAVLVTGPLAAIEAPLNFGGDTDAIEIRLLPRSYTLGRVTDLYLFFGPSPGLTPLDLPAGRRGPPD